jgi:hypothetical protein
MAATGTNTASGSFPRLAGFGAHGQQAARQLEKECAWLTKEGAPNGARRLARIDGYVGRLSLGDIVTLIDPNLAIDELAVIRQRKVRLAHTVRNTFALIPLVGTWIMLGLAAINYQEELAAHPSRSGTPFLELWQQGFGSGFPTFAYAAFGEFTVLIIVVALTVWVHAVEGGVTRKLAGDADRLYDVLDVLAAAIEGGAARAPENAAEWATAAREIIDRAMLETRELAQAGTTAIEQAKQTLAGAQAGLADVQQGGREFMETLTEQIRVTLAGLQQQNEAAIRAAAEQSQQTLRVLVDEQTRPLIQQLHEMLGQFGEQQAAFRGEVVNLAQDVTSIRTAAAELADGALGFSTAATSLAGIADSEREIAMRVTASFESITTAATAIGEVKDVLVTDVHATMPAMISGVTEASRGLAEVQRKLAETTGALARSTTALGTVATQLSRRTRSRFWPPWPFRSWQ